MKKDKIIYFFCGAFPLIAMNLMQLIGAFVALSFYVVKSLIQNKSYDDFMALLSNSASIKGYTTAALVCYLALSLIIAILLLKLYFHEKIFHSIQPITRKGTAWIILMIMVGIYALNDLIVGAFGIFAPNIYNNYNKLIDNMGITTSSVVSIIMAAFLAPIVEEIVFRYISLRMFEKCFDKFWIANFFQALFFGITHLNWIQGTYAFLVGLALGYICQKTGTVYASIWGHIVFNFIGSVIVGVIQQIFIDKPYVVGLCWAIGGALAFAGFVLFNKVTSEAEISQTE